jgi:hypothetical protein
MNGSNRFLRESDAPGPGPAAWDAGSWLGGMGGRVGAEGLQERCEAGVTDRVAGLTQPGGEGIAGERLPVPVQRVSRHMRSRH